MRSGQRALAHRGGQCLDLRPARARRNGHTVGPVIRLAALLALATICLGAVSAQAQSTGAAASKPACVLDASFLQQAYQATYPYDDGFLHIFQIAAAEQLRDYRTAFTEIHFYAPAPPPIPTVRIVPCSPSFAPI